jgi:hypothetical protein
MLRHSKISTTAEIYAHNVEHKLVAAQGAFLTRIKLATTAIQWKWVR